MKKKFTFQLRGNILIEDQAALEAQMREVLDRFPNFEPTFTSVEVWQDYNGVARLFNDDGTEYKAPVSIVNTLPEVEAEEA